MLWRKGRQVNESRRVAGILKGLFAEERIDLQREPRMAALSLSYGHECNRRFFANRHGETMQT
jgi:hypothetical protein